MTYNIVERYYI